MNYDKPLPLNEDSSVDAYLARTAGKPNGREADQEEAKCHAFGYLRGIQDRALAVRFIFRNGDSVCLPYAWLGPWEY